MQQTSGKTTLLLYPLHIDPRQSIVRYLSRTLTSVYRGLMRQKVKTRVYVSQDAEHVVEK